MAGASTDGFRAVINKHVSQDGKKVYIRPGYIPRVVRATKMDTKPTVLMAINEVVNSAVHSDGQVSEFKNDAADAEFALTGANGFTFVNDKGYFEIGTEMGAGVWLIECDGGGGYRDVQYIQTFKSAGDTTRNSDDFDAGPPPDPTTGKIFQPSEPTKPSGVDDEGKSDWFWLEA